MTATLVAGIVGGPVSGSLLTLHGVAGLAGWQWLFLIEGLPAVVLGVVVLGLCLSGPSDPSWLTGRRAGGRPQRVASEDDVATRPGAVHSFPGAMTSGRVWLLAVPISLCRRALRDGFLAAADHSETPRAAAAAILVGVLTAVP